MKWFVNSGWWLGASLRGSVTTAAIASLFSLVCLSACTDYVAEIDDQIKDLTQVVDPTEVVAGAMIDSRDGQIYNIVKIGGQVWMAENLNYETDNSSCYNNSAEYCDMYGRLYTWSSAKSICPDVWHLPSKAEWETLVNAVGGLSVVDRVLKSTSGWMDGNNGTDSFKFSVLPAGGSIGDEGYDALFWTSSEYSHDDAYSMNLGRLVYSGAMAFLGNNVKDRAFSVRCLKDDDEMPEFSPAIKQSSSSQSTESPSSSSQEEPESSSSIDFELVDGVLIDHRDGQGYKTTAIGSQIWMAENLNYEMDNSFCYDKDTGNCDKYGRLYIFDAAEKACPGGWHLPSRTEWETLIEAVGGTADAGKVLKSSTGWNSNGNGIDMLEFAALPAGSRNASETYSDEGLRSNFWSSSETGSGAYYVYMFYNLNSANINDLDKYNAFSVRCLKD